MPKLLEMTVRVLKKAENQYRNDLVNLSLQQNNSEGSSGFFHQIDIIVQFSAST